ncbi:hypothetical protein Vi05172_g35 [Venturia inaequalis]|uniref:Uncharacterized protein n=1 Tax=Venturia inaequalis TaxID=5025 RepID=A0A8H3Z8P8_VENIN|nr:hypothetical protein EG327_002335 [Venturia inaequalis]RDI89601.1 hypothetical protein Vi05172_g35 [Venturia inaequalis]
MSSQPSTLAYNSIPPPHTCGINNCTTTISAAYEHELHQKINHHLYIHHNQATLPNQHYCKICSHLVIDSSPETLAKMVKIHEESHEGAFSQRRLRVIKGGEKEEILKALKGQPRKARWMFAAYEGGNGGDFARF